jgi:hypothetical protein
MMRAAAGGLVSVLLTLGAGCVCVHPPNLVTSPVAFVYSQPPRSDAPYVEIKGAEVSITTRGRPVWVGLSPDNNSPNPPGQETWGQVGFWAQGACDFALIRLLRNDVEIAHIKISSCRANQVGQQNWSHMAIPPGAVSALDLPPAGTYTYRLQAKLGVGSTVGHEATLQVLRSKFFAFEF